MRFLHAQYWLAPMARLSTRGWLGATARRGLANRSPAPRPRSGPGPGPRPGQRWQGAGAALLWGLLGLQAPAQAQADAIVGRWISVSGAEQFEVKSNGFLRNCFASNKPGSASMGAWTRTAPGKYRVEFTHAVSRSCQDQLRLLRRYELSIVGQATVSRDELALFVSGEFPPDRFVRAGAAAAR